MGTVCHFDSVPFRVTEGIALAPGDLAPLDSGSCIRYQIVVVQFEIASSLRRYDMQLSLIHI